MSERLKKAIETAYELHKDQKRKSGEPYITHLFSVMSLVAEYGGNEDQMIAALLHDSIEDQGNKVDLEWIGRLFGSDVKKIVSDCTDDRGIKTWEKRKAAHIIQINNSSNESKLVVAADKLHNLRCCVKDFRDLDHSDEFWEMRFKRNRELNETYFRTLHDVIFSTLDNSIRHEYENCLEILFKVSI